MDIVISGTFSEVELSNMLENIQERTYSETDGYGCTGNIKNIFRFT